MRKQTLFQAAAVLCACAATASAQPAKIPLNSDAVEWRVKPQAELK